ncbi:hypothetical protein TcasGA2_TC002226 [Tribolium castaneum]|uniref:Tyr recombinase domain-containing protein n=1 Tax=Tribolium castaneum TaxID=7070 RepID=D6WYA4_TRICA|nr:hypothetical protein TcasGA2_TC002226 [Tribolium castaneum]
MSVDDIEDRGNVLVVQIPDTKTYNKRIFTIVNGGNSVRAIDVFRQYRSLKPKKISHKRFFLNYKNKKCTVQPVGYNTFSKIPQKIAQFLKLPNDIEYIGHSFRRSPQLY